MNHLAALHKKDLKTIGWHVGAWLVVFSLPYLLHLVYEDNAFRNPESKAFLYLGFCTGLLWVFTFYFNAYVLLPLFIHKRRWLLYGVCIVFIFTIILGIHSLFFHYFLPNKEFKTGLSALFNAPAYLLSLAVSAIYHLVLKNIQESRLAQEKHEENLKTELSFLRSQISPHFIFNVLNNIVALARLKSDKLEPTVLKLSALMQYMLYDANDETVLLRTEIEYLKSYIDLQQQRFGDKIKLNLVLDVADDFYDIEPMLLIPFVENAFKHGIGLIQDPFINISIKEEKGRLNFEVINKYTSVHEIKDKQSGIGLNNVKRRLKLLYPDKHVLVLEKVKDEYVVNLKLELK